MPSCKKEDSIQRVAGMSFRLYFWFDIQERTLLFSLAMAADGFCMQTTPNQVSRIRVRWCLGGSVHAM